ncbi:DUF6597 domain-containing transcriptional factor [Roseimarinus sediminis]|uniref:DUF6597 domain-containing transcriptional factor n=1 Tax=Roseimarinus sediminis TaxID=1610899 RepID=UPI003D1EA837
MIFKIIEPNDLLKPYVHSIQLTDMNNGERLYNQKIVPYGYCGLIFNYKGSCTKTDNIHGKNLLPHTFIVGLTDRPVTLTVMVPLGPLLLTFIQPGFIIF